MESATPSPPGSWFSTILDEHSAYEVRLVGIFLVLLLVLGAVNAAVWTFNRDVLSDVYKSPDKFSLPQDAVYISHVITGVDVNVAAQQAEADRAADRVPEAGDDDAAPVADRLSYTNSIYASTERKAKRAEGEDDAERTRRLGSPGAGGPAAPDGGPVPDSAYSDDEEPSVAGTAPARIFTPAQPPRSARVVRQASSALEESGDAAGGRGEDRRLDSAEEMAAWRNEGAGGGTGEREGNGTVGTPSSSTLSRGLHAESGAEGSSLRRRRGGGAAGGGGDAASSSPSNPLVSAGTTGGRRPSVSLPNAGPGLEALLVSPAGTQLDSTRSAAISGSRAGAATEDAVEMAGAAALGLSRG
jgi:hypothetical protein